MPGHFQFTPPQPSGQDRQDVYDVEELADASVRIHNLQNATRSARRVQGADQFAHAGRINVGKSRQIQQNSPLATSKKCLDSLAQLGVHRRLKCPLNCKDRTVRALFERGHHGLFWFVTWATTVTDLFDESLGRDASEIVMKAYRGLHRSSVLSES